MDKGKTKQLKGWAAAELIGLILLIPALITLMIASTHYGDHTTSCIAGVAFFVVSARVMVIMSGASDAD